MRLWQKAVHLWDAGQVSYRGAYSLARFQSFYAYSQKATWCRGLLVLVFAAVPPLSVITIIDAIPLQDPRDGWHKNWVFWIRCALAVLALTFASVLQFHVTAPAAALSVKKCVSIAVIVAVGYPFSVMGVAVIWGFPVPFQIITCVPIWNFWIIGAIAFMLGKNHIATNAELRRQTKRYLNIIQAQAPLLLVYPAYSAVFMRLQKSNQTAFIFVLPVIKFVLKNSLAKASAGLGDFIPTIVISIDLFNAIYQLKSMQSSETIWITVGIVSIDFALNVVTMWRLHRFVAGLYSLQTSKGKPSTSLDLLAIIAKSCKDFQLLNQEYWVSLQLSGNTTTTTSSSIMAVESNPTGIMSRNRVLPKAFQMSNGIESISKVAVKPSDQIHHDQQESNMSDRIGIAAFVCGDQSLKEARTLMLKRSLQLLYRCEFMLLVDYTKCAIPVIYIAHLTILFQFPNRKYYPDVEMMTESRLRHVIIMVSAYALCELGSLFYVHWVIKRKFRFSAFRQLAFILEKDFLVIQASFMSWILIIFQFWVVHFGEFISLLLELLQLHFYSLMTRC